jgi:hypothetical protein
MVQPCESLIFIVLTKKFQKQFYIAYVTTLKVTLYLTTPGNYGMNNNTLVNLFWSEESKSQID